MDGGGGHGMPHCNNDTPPSPGSSMLGTVALVSSLHIAQGVRRRGMFTVCQN